MSVSHVLLCHGAQQDQLAQSLIPFNAPSGLIAHKSCWRWQLFVLCHFSLCLVGTTEYSIVLRILMAIELFKNAHFYGNHPRIKEAMQSGCSFGEATVSHLP